MALTVATALFVQSLITAFGLGITVPNYILYAGILLLVYLFAVRDIRFSSRLGLASEVVSVAIVAVVCFLSWQHHGLPIDTKQNTLKGANFGAGSKSIVFGIISYVGFESARTFGKETPQPQGGYPPRRILAPILAGAVYIVTAYLIVQGFNEDTAKLGNSSGPLAHIVVDKGASLTILVCIGAMVSCFACAQASMKSFSRNVFSLGRD